jgi:hypothetical protein
MENLVAHVAGARYFQLINYRYFRMPFDAFVRQQVSDLVTAGAAVLEDEIVSDSGP